MSGRKWAGLAVVVTVMSLLVGTQQGAQAEGGLLRSTLTASAPSDSISWRVVHGTATQTSAAESSATLRLRASGHRRLAMIAKRTKRQPAVKGATYRGTLHLRASSRSARHRVARLQIREWRDGRLVHVTSGRRVRLGRHAHLLSVRARARHTGDHVGLTLLIKRPRRSSAWIVVGGILRRLHMPPGATDPSGPPTTGGGGGGTGGGTGGGSGGGSGGGTGGSGTTSGNQLADPNQFPITNQISNASFESPTGIGTGAGATVTQAQLANAANGGYADQVTWDGTSPAASLVLNGTGTTSAAQQYQAGVWVAADTAIGQQVTLTVQELSGGVTVAQTTSSPVTLTSGFQYVGVTATAKSAGDTLQLVVTESAPATGDAYYVDSATLALTGSTIGAFAIDSDQENQLGDTSKYAYVVTLGEAVKDYDLVDKIHAANPSTKALLYLDAGATMERSCPSGVQATPYNTATMTFGVDYCWLKANNHLNWILRNASGSYAEYGDYAGFLAMDMSNPAYAKQLALDAIQVAHQDGWDGVYLDDVNTVVGHELSTVYQVQPNGSLSPIGDSAYGDGTVAFMQNFKADMLANGGANLIRSANVFADPWSDTEAAQGLKIAATLDLYNREHQSQWSEGNSCGPFEAMESFATTAILNYQQQLEATGASYSGVEYGSTDKSSARDQQMMTFSRASFLLGWNGEPGSAFFFRPCGGQDPADDAWTADVGIPSGNVQTLTQKTFRVPMDPTWDQPAYVYERQFTGGIVLLNEMPQAYTVQLDGTYKTQTGQVVSGSYTLPAATPANRATGDLGITGSGAILTRVSN